MKSRNDLNEALQFLHQNYPDALVNNNKYVIENEPAEHCEIFKMTSMKQSVFKNIIYRKSSFENVALTGSTFDNVTFVDSKIVGNSFANCNFTSTVIDGSRATLSANNFSQSNFEQSSFVRVKFFRSGILNALYHKCDFTKVQFRGSTLEGTKFIGCSFSDCDFGNVNIDYSLFSKNEYDKVVFPFYQIAYIIGAADFLRDDSAQIYAQAGDKKVSSREFFEQADRLKIYYLDKSEYFPACNLSIAQQKFDDAKRYLLIGIEQALVNKNFRMISNFCRLAKYHGMADERIKSKILKSMGDFIQKNNIPDSQLNFYLIYIGNIKDILNEGAGDSITLRYTIKTNLNKDSADSVRRLNHMVNELNYELSKLKNIEGYEVTVSNHSPFEIALQIISVMVGLPPAIEAVLKLITRIKGSSNKGIRQDEDYVEIDADIQRKYVDERIERMKRDIIQLRKIYSDKELDEHIVEVTQSLKTDLEELYSKDIMIYKIRKKEN